MDKKAVDIIDNYVSECIANTNFVSECELFDVQAKGMKFSFNEIKQIQLRNRAKVRLSTDVIKGSA
jgi:hypothetical protein